MTADTLTSEELTELVRRVFQPRDEDRSLAILVDLPDDTLPDTPRWRARREMAAGWAQELAGARSAHGLEVTLAVYPNVHSNNAELPASCWRWAGSEIPRHVDDLAGHLGEPFEALLASHRLIIAPTQLSTTAPLKVLAPRFGFRAATMPGFSVEMVPALRLDYTEVNRRVGLLKRLLDESLGAGLRFAVDGVDVHRLHVDLRFRTAHASGGLLPDPGTAGNLPSGEAYIVPYEGEREGEPSASAGSLPVQLGDEVVVFEVRHNRALGISSRGPASERERRRLVEEPARGNLAELGLGVLADFGIAPIGEVLLDEKLGLHLAFGRSEHFGGQVGPGHFSRPDAVVHQDHVYIPELQPRVRVEEVRLLLAGGAAVELMRDGRYVIDFGG